MFKKSRFRGCFDKKCGKRAQTLLKSASQHLYHIPSSLSRKLCSKKSLWLTCQILGLLVNTLAADEKYPVLNRDNLTIPIQMQLSQKQKTFSHCFRVFLKSSLNFEHFQTKGDSHSFYITEITDSENVLREMSKKSCFREPFEKPHGKCAQVLFTSASDHLYKTHWSLPSQLSWKSLTYDMPNLGTPCLHIGCPWKVSCS